MPGVLDASAVRRWCSASLDALTAARRRIDDLNVFPVPDGDTGTNMGQTLGAASAQLRATESADAAVLLSALAAGAARGARGNSGVILAQFLGGLAQMAVEADGEPIGATLLARGLEAGSVAARGALADPVEGTILSVALAAAQAARRVAERDSDDPSGLLSTARAAADAAAQALELTTGQLPALAEAGVVDAGGLGLVLVLDALVGALGGGLLLRYDATAFAPRAGSSLQDATHHERPRETGSEEFGYEVQYLLNAPDDALAQLRETLSHLGDSIAVVPVGHAQWNVHVHVNDVGAAIEAGIAAGPTHQISVTRFADQLASRLAGTPDVGPGAPLVAVVAVAPGPGLAHLFAAEGVAVVDRSGDERADSLRADVVKAVLATRAAGVVVLARPANMPIVDAAAIEARAQGRDITVIAMRSVVQGLAALAVHDPSRPFTESVAAMAEAAGATRCAEVFVAPEPVRTQQGMCGAGDVVGAIEGEPVIFGADLVRVAAALLERILSGGGELVTVVPGVQVALHDVAALHELLGERLPEIEVSVLSGGQTSPHLLLGIE